MYGASPAKFRSFPPPAITLQPPLPPHDDPWPTSAPLQPVTPLAEPACTEAYDRDINACHRSMEAAAPDYASMMSVPQKLDEPETPPMLAVLVKWIASVALGFKTQLRCDLDI